MIKPTHLIRCSGCGVEITWAPLVVPALDKPTSLLYYCCQDCLEGRGCDCSLRQELDEDRERGSTPPS